jgi:hypothetical protein
MVVVLIKANAAIPAGHHTNGSFSVMSMDRRCPRKNCSQVGCDAELCLELMTITGAWKGRTKWTRRGFDTGVAQTEQARRATCFSWREECLGTVSDVMPASCKVVLGEDCMVLWNCHVPSLEGEGLLDVIWSHARVVAQRF